MPPETAVSNHFQAVVAGSGKFDAIDVDKDDQDQDLALQQNIQRDTRSQQYQSRSLRKQSQKEEIVIDSDDEPTTTAVYLDGHRKKKRSTLSPEKTGPVRTNQRSAGSLSQPKDAVVVRPPTGSRQDMSFAQHRSKFGGPYNPLNTMNKSKELSSKKEYFIKKTREGRPLSAESRQSAGPSRSSIVLQGNGEPPLKRARIGLDRNADTDVPPSRQWQASQPTAMQHITKEGSVRDRTPLAEMYGFSGDAEIQLNSEDHTVSVLSPAGSSNARRKTLLGGRPNGQRHNPITQARTSPHDDEKFMREATRQRKAAPSDSEDELVVTQTPTGIGTKDLNHESPTKSQITSKTKRQTLAPTTPAAAKTLKKYDDESPDELSKEQVGKKQHRVQTPKLSPVATSRREVVTFPLHTFLYHTYSMDNCEIEVYERGKTFSVTYHESTLSQDALTSEWPLNKITQMFLPPEEDDNIVILLFSSNVITGNKCFMQFTSPQAVDSWKELLQRLSVGIRTHTKRPGYNKRALAKAYALARERAAEARDTESQSPPEPVRDPNRYVKNSPAPKISHSKPIKLRNQLDSPIQNAENASPETSAPRPSDGLSSTHVLKESVQEPFPNLGRERITRSTERRTATRPKSISPPISAHPRRQGTPWKRPLTYPRDGIKRESVTWDDLARLEDHEFLNDSLVGLFLRYLQEECKESTKRMHFFSTFFYETLTRSKKEINYRGVCNWTKKIDIFNRDFIIVPVNENAHWFVMIICNPRALVEEPKGPSGEDLAVNETNDVNMNTEMDYVQLKDLAGGDLFKVTTAKDIDLDFDEPADQASPQKRAGGRKYKRRSLPKYETSRPVIITLDSLAMGRSPNASVLKDYLIQEACEKRGQVIEKTDIAGMTGKGIPTQANFSDCGLYLCMYLEQFMRDPDAFVKSILQRDTDVFPWPKHIPHGALRQRLYDMLQSLYKQQHGEAATKVLDVGNILLRNEDYLTPGQKSMKSGLDNVDKYYGINKQPGYMEQQSNPELSSIVGENNSAPTTLVGGHPYTDRQKNDAEILTAENDPIVIEDESQSQGKLKEDDLTSKYFHDLPKGEKSRARVPDAGPRELADRLRHNRSPHQRSCDDEERFQVTSVSMPQGSERDHEPEGRRSVSTEFLDGLESYEEIHQSADNQKMAITPPQEIDEEFNGFGDLPVRYGSTVPESVNDDDVPNRESETMLIED